jgi:hypothetical protein
MVSDITQYSTFPNYIPTILEDWEFSYIRTLTMDRELLFEMLV